MIDVELIIGAIKTVTGEGSSVPLHAPTFDGNELQYLTECLDTTNVASTGRFIAEFEAGLREFTGSKYVVAVASGTAGLHIALKLAGVVQNDEVLVPDLTFIATPNAVTYCGAVPHLVDVERRTLGLDPLKLRDYLNHCSEIRNGLCINLNTNRVIRAVVPMHTFGHSVDLDGLMSVAHDFNIALVEDAAESLGSKYYGRHTGTFGLSGVLSFNGNKTITTGGGGAILTNDSLIACRARHLISTAKAPHPWEFIHDQIGYNYRMPNINAAIGCAQLEQLPKKLFLKRELYQKYQAAFFELRGIRLFVEPVGCQSNYWLQTIILDEQYAHLKNDVLRLANNIGIHVRPAWTLIHRATPYANTPRMDLSCSTSLSARLLNIPSSPSLIKTK
jgi:perosamine synthetase